MRSRRSFLKYGGLAGISLCSHGPLLADGLPGTLNEFGYGDVELAPGLAQTQFEQTQAVLMSLDEDSLLKPWRLRAGLPAPGPDLGGWYDEVVPYVEAKSGGHGFAPGHCFGQWLSALARGYAVNRDAATRAKLVRILDMYGQAISPLFYTNFRYPAYDYDKLVNGLVDSHRWADVPGAYALLDRTTDAAEPHLPPRALDRTDEAQWRTSIGEDATAAYTRDESYTIAENLYLAARHGAGERYRRLARRFLLDETFFDPLAANINVLANRHAYSYFNSLNSAMQAYLSEGDRKHLLAASNGFDMIVATQSFSTGGWGPDENFSSDPGALYKSLTDSHRGFETPCGSLAHFKLTRYLLRVTKDGRYGDSMERVFYNTVLGAKRLEPDGRAFYYSDYNMNARRTYFPDAWPCCSGTLPQVAADYRVLAYFHDADGMYVNLYLPSTVKWTTADGALLSLSQQGSYPVDHRVSMRLRLSRGSQFALRLRIPAWCDAAAGVRLRVNGARFPVAVQAGFTTLKRAWRDGDRIDLDLALPTRLEMIDEGHPNTVSLVRGPLVLFALGENIPQVKGGQLLDAKRIPGQTAWQATTDSGPIKLVPFTEVGDSTYATYLQIS